MSMTARCSHLDRTILPPRTLIGTICMYSSHWISEVLLPLRLPGSLLDYIGYVWQRDSNIKHVRAIHNLSHCVDIMKGNLIFFMVHQGIKPLSTVRGAPEVPLVPKGTWGTLMERKTHKWLGRATLLQTRLLKRYWGILWKVRWPLIILRRHLGWAEHLTTIYLSPR